MDLTQDSIQQILTLVDARVPIVWTVTCEEGRLINELVSQPVLKETLILYWSATSGLVDTYDQYRLAVECTGKYADTKLITKALNFVKEYQSQDKPVLVIMRDPHIQLSDMAARQFRDMYELCANQNKIFLFVSPFLAHGGEVGIHPLLERQVVVVDYQLPTHKQIVAHIKSRVGEATKNKKDVKDLLGKYTQAEYNQFGKALQGLSLLEIDNALATLLTAQSRLDAEILAKEKKQLVRKNQLLEFVEVNIEEKDVGGLDLAKEYVNRYSNMYSVEAQKFGVEPLRGLILTGIAGTGKSLLARATAHILKLPLVRLDIGKIMGGIVGSSEANMRSAIQTLESIQPCVCWLDELEKALSGTQSSNRSDGGTLSRVFGTLLTAMQEGLKGVTLLATSNDISQLPPELIRRFNDIFFMDLPNRNERWEILAIHLNKRNRKIEIFEEHKDIILNALEDFTGAEIEKAVKDSITRAFYLKAQDVELEHLLSAIKGISPISKVQAEQVRTLQQWAKDHAKFASSPMKEIKTSAKELTSRFDKFN